MNIQHQTNTKSQIAPSTMADHQELSDRVTDLLCSAPREHLIGAITQLAQTIVGSVAVCPDEETEVVSCLAVIDGAFNQDDWLIFTDTPSEN